MDEHETIPRREAILGLTLLGALSIALVATIMFRIVHSAPRSTPPVGAPTWAAAPAAPAGSAATTPPTMETVFPPFDERYAAHPAAAALPPAVAIPTMGDGSSSVPAMSLAPAFVPAQEAPTLAEPPSAEPAFVEPPAAEPYRPRFVAPSGR